MQNLKNSFASFWKYRYLLQNLITRDFKLKYRRSVLGVAWSVLNPLLTCLVMWAVFGALFNQRGDGIEDFPLFLIIGQLMFNFFRESTSMAMESVLKNGPLSTASHPAAHSSSDAPDTLCAPLSRECCADRGGFRACWRNNPGKVALAASLR